jgi:hypothetical protein
VPRPSKSQDQLALLDAVVKASEDGDEPEIGYHARLFTQTSLPYKDPGADVEAWGRTNGNLTLIVRPGIRGFDENHKAVSFGYPFGTIPRMLLSWMCTEAVRTQSPVLELGPSVKEFMRSLPSPAGSKMLATGGKSGSITRLRDQMNRLFNAQLTVLRREVHGDVEREEGLKLDVIDGWDVSWAGSSGSADSLQSGSRVRLSRALFDEITLRPVPVDLNALGWLSGSPMRMDTYLWLVHRLSYLTKRTTVPWSALKEQLGTGLADTKQGIYQFKRNFEDNLAYVRIVYPDAKVEITASGVVLRPSKTHIPLKGLRALTAG